MPEVHATRKGPFKTTCFHQYSKLCMHTMLQGWRWAATCPGWIADPIERLEDAHFGTYGWHLPYIFTYFMSGNP